MLRQSESSKMYFNGEAHLPVNELKVVLVSAFVNVSLEAGVLPPEKVVAVDFYLPALRVLFYFVCDHLHPPTGLFMSEIAASNFGFYCVALQNCLNQVLQV